MNKDEAAGLISGWIFGLIAGALIGVAVTKYDYEEHILNPFGITCTYGCGVRICGGHK